jgi:hypothetical protein
MRTLIISFTFLLSASGLITSSQQLSKQTNIAVRVEESQIDSSSKGIIFSDCIIVRNDGYSHLERRRQQLPSSIATLRVYELQLDAADMEQLSQIVNNKNIQELPDFSSPPVPPDNPSLRSGFQATLIRNNTVHRIGYMNWSGRDDPGSTAFGSKQVREELQTSAAAMEPLRQWLHHVEGMAINPSDSIEPTQCSL